MLIDLGSNIQFIFFVSLFLQPIDMESIFPVIPIHNDMIFEFKGSIFALFSSFLL